MGVVELNKLKTVLKEVDQDFLSYPALREVHRAKSIQLGHLHDDYQIDEVSSLSHLIAANRGQWDKSSDLPQVIRLSQKTGFYGLTSLFVNKYLSLDHSLETKAKLLIDTAEFHARLAPNTVNKFRIENPRIIFHQQNKVAMFKYLIKAVETDFDQTYDAVKNPERIFCYKIKDGTYKALFKKRPFLGSLPQKPDSILRFNLFVKEAERFLELGKNYNAFVLLYEMAHNHHLDEYSLVVLIRCLVALGQTQQARDILNLLEKRKFNEMVSKIAS